MTLSPPSDASLVCVSCAAAPCREADEEETRNPDRARAKRENGLERDQTRNQR